MYYACFGMRKIETIDIALGKVLRGLRIKANLTQEELALDAGLERTYISMLELGQRTPTTKTLVQLSRCLNLKLSELMLLMEEAYTEETGEELVAKTKS